MICGVCIEFGIYIDTIIQVIKIPKIEIENQILTHNLISAKLEDDHLKRMVERSRIKGVIEGMLENFLVNPTRSGTR